MVTKYALAALACLAIAIAVIVVRPVQTPGPLSRDFEAYWSAGTTYNGHADPYGRAIWNAERGITGIEAQREELLPFIGPPHTLLAWSLAARLRYVQATYVWWVILAISLFALVATVIRGSRVRLDARHFCAALLLAVAFAPICSGLALGQASLPAFLGAALLPVLSNRSMLGGVLAGCLALAQPNATLGLASQIGRNRATLAMLLALPATYVLGAIAVGWSWPSAYFAAALRHVEAERFVAIQFNAAAIAFGLGASLRVSELVYAGLAALTIAGAVAIALRVRDRYARFAAFSALVPFAAGFFHEHDFVVSFAAALWCALRTRGGIRALALAGTLLAGFDWLGLAQRPSGIAQCALLAAAECAAFVLLGKEIELRISAPVMLGFAVLVVAASNLALAHPAPVWPDPLVAFHAPPQADAATVWFDEQRQSGLLTPVPVWGVLRSLSLLGSALLAYAIYRHSSYCRTA